MLLYNRKATLYFLISRRTPLVWLLLLLHWCPEGVACFMIVTQPPSPPEELALRPTMGCFTMWLS